MLNLNTVIISSCVFGDFNKKILDETISSIEKCINVANFKEIIIFHTYEDNFLFEYKEKYKYINFKKINYFKTKKAYAYWLMNLQGLEFKNYSDDEHILIIQNDSWIVNPNAWTDKFLEYDYIGAIFPIYKKEINGNGGFCLRSIKLIKYLASLPSEIIDLYREDISICITNRKILEEKGFTFAPIELCKQFSIEGRPYINQFGHHCAYNIKIIKENNSTHYIYYNKVWTDNPIYFQKNNKKYLYLYESKI